MHPFLPASQEKREKKKGEEAKGIKPPKEKGKKGRVWDS